jgi:signal transduction histidine kinase/DNA-binding response OmpR family regulator
MNRFDGTRWTSAGLPPHFGVDLGPSHLRVGTDGALWVVTTLESWYDPHYELSAAAKAKPATLQSLRYLPERRPPDTFLRSAVTELSEKQSATFLWEGLDPWSASPAESLQYSYRIDAGPWSPFSRATNAVLTNLRPGNHTFAVRARDRDLNVDPTPALAEFVVTPIIWRQPWFIALLAVFVSTIALLLWLMMRLRIRHVVQLGELKLQFFTNISHELRTPLTAILGPLERMSHEATETRTKHRLEIIRQNATRMLRLVDQILDFRRVQMRATAPVHEPTELVAFLRAQRERLQGYAEDKAIKFEFTARPEEFHGYIDQDKLIKIVDNLISNAIKYTPAGGEIGLALECAPLGQAENKYELKLSVSDSGIGIAPTDKQRIFELFYRASSARTLPANGTGIGLTLTKELVEQCGGSITVQSPVFPAGQPTCGSRFIVTIPIERADGATGETHPLEPALAEIPSSDAASKATVLLIEDNADIRRLLRDELEDTYHVLEAEDGVTGLSLAEARSPDCVISDIMMPGLTGDVVCARLKANELTSHIPVILLTARKSSESQRRGLQAGADDYVVKPVSFSLLRLRLENLLKARATLREKFGQQVYLAPSEVAVTPIDEQFIRRALRVVEEHMDDPEFDVETFARAMGLSRASLFRKFKALSDNTPRDFIRDMRLERARQLLATGQLNVSETAARVGFSDLSHFSACFRKKFGETPSEFARSQSSAPQGQ